MTSEAAVALMAELSDQKVNAVALKCDVVVRKRRGGAGVLWVFY